MVSSCSILFTDFRTVIVFSLGWFFTLSVIFYDLRWNLQRDDLKWPKKKHFWVANVSFWGTFLLKSVFGFSVRAPEVPFSRCKKSHKMRKKMRKMRKMALPVPERKNRKHFLIEMCPQNLHSTPQNQYLATRKWFFGHFKSYQCKFPLKS